MEEKLQERQRKIYSMVILDYLEMLKKFVLNFLSKIYSCTYRSGVPQSNVEKYVHQNANVDVVQHVHPYERLWRNKKRKSVEITRCLVIFTVFTWRSYTSTSFRIG